ncbi:MAG: ROK family protein [Actinobacteria bacterium]|nr:ROK family protein [Actinomycetota bacterium]
MTDAHPGDEAPLREDSAVRFLRAIHRHGLREARGWRDDSFRGLTQTNVATRIHVSRPTASRLAGRARRLLAPSVSGLALDPAVAGVAVGIDFGQRHHRIALADVHGQLFQPARPADYETGAPTGMAYTSLEWATERVEALIAEAGVQPEEIVAVGVSVPGPVNQRTKKLRQIPPGMDRSWEVVEIDQHLQARLRVPSVTIESDSNASALAEHIWGTLRETSDAIYVKVSQRCACSLLIDHRLYRGADGCAGRLGMTWIPDGRPGRWTPVEDVFSFQALGKSGWEQMTGEELVSLAQSDGALDQALRRGARGLGVALAPLIDALNPESVVIGGALGAPSLTWVASDLLDGIATFGDSPQRMAISGRIRSASFTRGSAVRGVIASALLERAAVRIAAEIPPA